MTVDPERLKLLAAEAQERARQEREKQEQIARAEYAEKVEVAMRRAERAIPNIERALEQAARNGKTGYSTVFSSERIYSSKMREYEDLVQKPAETIAEHFRDLGFDARVEKESTIDDDGAGAGPTNTLIVIQW